MNQSSQSAIVAQTAGGKIEIAIIFLWDDSHYHDVQQQILCPLEQLSVKGVHFFIAQSSEHVVVDGQSGFFPITTKSGPSQKALHWKWPPAKFEIL